MGKPFTLERLIKIRRMRKARRLFKQLPLFAYELLQLEYTNYSDQEFWDDLRIRTKRKSRKRKSPLVRFGRYNRIEQLKCQFYETGNYDLIIKAHQLRKNITRPYRVLVRLKGKYCEYSFCPLIPITHIEQLTASFKDCTSEQEVEEIIDQFRKAH